LNYRKKIILLIIISSALRLLFASATELGADEVYYWTYALKLQWNYFDHPPLVAWLIRLTTVNLSFHSELFVRLGAIISSAICTWLIFKLGALINNLRAGWFAALLYTSSIYCSITAGANILPDSPQMIFWLSGILLLVKISRLTDNIPKADLLWLLFGLVSGLCIMSKVDGVFLWFGVILYVLFVNRDWLKYRGIYLSAIITLIVVSPIIIWNIQNNFISYKFHSSRLSPLGSGVHLTGFIKAILQQIAVCNPVNFFITGIGLFLALKGKVPVVKREINLLLYVSLPLIIVILIISLFRETFAHWPGPAYSSLLILPAVNLASDPKNREANIPKVIKWALAYLMMIALLQIVTINYFPGTLSVQKQGPKTGANDLTLYTYGWKEIGGKFDSLYRSDVAKKIMPPNAPIIVTNWFPAASIEFYLASNTKQEVLGIGNVLDLHQYYWTNKYKKQLKGGDDAYYIVPSDAFYYRTSDEVKKCFKTEGAPFVIAEYRSGLICRYISVFRMKGYLKNKK
jgi:4-amino-4-deoxy-L-arabinose transferase-like glycosyltransferase